MADAFYSSPEWRALRERVLARDGYRCTVARLFGGACSGQLHVHHIKDRDQHPELALDEDNCGTACAAHHPVWEALRRWLARRDLEQELADVRCPHRHVTPEGRRLCEERRARARGLTLV